MDENKEIKESFDKFSELTQNFNDTIKLNEIKIKDKFKELQIFVNEKINKVCFNQIKILKDNGILSDKQLFLSIEEGDNNNLIDIENLEENSIEAKEKSLYLFNLKQKNSFQKEIDSFKDCVIKITEKESEYVEISYDAASKILSNTVKCQENVMKKFKQNVELNELNNGYTKCLKLIEDLHTKFTDSYTKKIDTLINKQI